MTRHSTRLLSAAVFASVLFVPPAVASGQSQELSDLRRRLDSIEQRLFQQQLSQPPTPGGQAIERLQMRLDLLEREIASERVNRMAASVMAPKSDPKAPAPKTLEARLVELETQRAADARTIAALIKRIEALEKK